MFSDLAPSKGLSTKLFAPVNNWKIQIGSLHHLRSRATEDWETFATWPFYLSVPGLAKIKGGAMIMLLSHSALALLIQAAVALPLRNIWAGAAAAAAWAISRELTQAEYRWIEKFGGGLRANMPWWGGMDLRVWHSDALLDWTMPSATVVIAAWLIQRTRSRIHIPVR